MELWYVSSKPGIDNGIGPHDPDDQAAVIVFLNQESAAKYVEDYDLTGCVQVRSVFVCSPSDCNIRNSFVFPAVAPTVEQFALPFFTNEN